MKHLKLTLFSLIALFVSATMLVSCSEDNETTTNETTTKNVDSFLKSFYKKKIELGKPLKINSDKDNNLLNRTTEIQNYSITEVFVGDDTRARGYIISDKETNEFLYFIDVDRVDYKLTSINIDENEMKISENINTLDNYLSTNEFDYIEIAEDINSGLPQSNKFWGWGNWQYTECKNGKKNAIRVYHILWLSADYETQMGIPCEIELN